MHVPLWWSRPNRGRGRFVKKAMWFDVFAAENPSIHIGSALTNCGQEEPKHALESHMDLHQMQSRQ
jgi:hypothetical protein